MSAVVDGRPEASRRPPKRSRPTPVPRVRSALIDRLSVDDLDLFWDVIAATCPVIEESAADDQMVVTFAWQDLDGDAEAVLLFADRLTDETSVPETLLEHVPGTDLWHASFQMAADWRASYSFLVQRRDHPAPWLSEDPVGIRAALDRGHLDPRNPATCRNRAGVLQSVVRGPAAPEQPWLEERADVERGRVLSDEAPGAHTVWIYDPPGVDPATALPLLVVLDGEVWVGSQSLPTTLDNLLADGIGPVRAVFLDSGGREARRADLSADGSGASYVADELLSWVRLQRGVLPGPEAVTVLGQGLGGLTALRLGLTRPDQVGAVISHSASLGQDPLTEHPVPPRLRLHLAHGSQEWALDGPHRALADRLAELGPQLQVSVHNGGHDYAWWRGGVAEGLVWLLASPEESDPT